MPNLHDIEKRIKSVSSTKQITRTMEMVAGCEGQICHRAYSDALLLTPTSMTEMLQGVAARVQASSRTPLLEKRDERKACPVCGRGFRPRPRRRLQLATSCATVEKTIRAEKARRVSRWTLSPVARRPVGYFNYRGVDAGS